MKLRFVTCFSLMLAVVLTATAQSPSLSSNDDLFEITGYAWQPDGPAEQKIGYAIAQTYSGNDSIALKVIAAILADTAVIKDDSVLKALWMAGISAAMRQSDYSAAMRYTMLALKSPLNSEADKQSLKDFLQFASVLRKADQPELLVSGKTNFPLRKDQAGLINIPVGIGGNEYDFIFDTGANYSVITESLADSLGLQLLPDKVMISAGTGKALEVSLGIAEELWIGNYNFSRIPFLVLPDKMLSFPLFGYFIKGIIGMPVIREMGDIVLTQDAIRFEPVQSEIAQRKDLILSSWVALVRVNLGGKDLPFILDTGAQKSAFYYRAMQYIELDEDAKKKKQKIAGAGGMVKQKGYRIPALVAGFPGKEVKMEDIFISGEESDFELHQYPGLIGLDVLGKFDEVRMNFRTMAFEVK